MSKLSASRTRIYVFCTVAVVTVVAGLLLGAAPEQRKLSPVSSSAMSRPKPVTPDAARKIQATLATLPLSFEQNQGQTDAQVKYMARAGGYQLYLTSSSAVLSFASHSAKATSRPKQMMEQRLLGYSRQTRHLIGKPAFKNSEVRPSIASLRLQLLNANPAAQVEGHDLLSSRTNYFIGDDPHNWHADVKEFARVSYSNVYPGVDLVYHGQQKQLEFDFIVSPNASPQSIGLNFAGARRVSTDEAGNLLVDSSAGSLTLHRPVAYQQINGAREIIDAQFLLKAHNQIGFALGNYDHNRELVIDPSISYATYIGGNGDDEAYGITTDGSGNSYITGESDSTSGFPGSNPSLGGYDTFVVKINANGSRGYTTFVGGSGDDLGSAIATNSALTAGTVFVSGITTSTDLPVSSGAAQLASGSPSGSTCFTGNGSAPCTDGFVFSLNPAGTVSYLTYLGGNGDDGAFGIAVDGSGDAYVTGSTFSPNFPVPNGLFTALNAGVASNPVFEDGFVTEINPTGTQFVYSTYLGGENNDYGNAIAVDGSGNAYVTGATTSATQFPITAGAFQTQCGSDGTCNAGGGNIFFDAFVTELAAGGTSLTYSTYLGGSSDDYGLGIGLDGQANIYVTGQTTDDNLNASTGDFPVVTGGFGPNYGNSNPNAGSNAFVSELRPAGQGTSDLLYSSYLGGSTADVGLAITADSSGNAYVTGTTLSTDFPTVSAFQPALNGDSDAFVTLVASGGSTLTYSSYLGGAGDENFDPSNSTFLGAGITLGAGTLVAGSTSSSTGFPVTSSALQPAYGGDPFDAFAATVAPDFNVTAPSTTTPSTVAPGAGATVAITLTAQNGYSSPVNLTCSVTGTGTPLPACGSFSPASPITPTGGGASTTLTITTTGAQAALVRPRKFFYALWLPIAGLSLLGMGFSSAPTRRKKLLGFLMIGMVMTALLLMPACGGSSSNNGGGGGGGGCSGCTAAGNYTITITGTGTDAGATRHTATVTLAVN